MKCIKELKFEELTLEQKLGMTLIGYCHSNTDEAKVAYLEEMIKKRALGAVWVLGVFEKGGDFLKRFIDAADYPLLVFSDAESGFGYENRIGMHNSIGVTDSEELAYTFGKVTALNARKYGINVVCNPVVDMTENNVTCGGVTRSLGSDKERVTALAAAIVRGMHDAGVLAVLKHYPGNTKSSIYIDSHMGETNSDETAAELLDYNLYPYVELNKMGLADGVMLGHSRFYNIDEKYPASLSKEVIGVFRKQGFEGFAITDALSMMGVVAKFGKKGSVGLAVGNAAEIALAWNHDNELVMSWLKESYEEGVITPERLDEAVKRVLAAQHKVALMQPKFDAVTEEDIKTFNRINTDSVYAKFDEGFTPALDRNGKYLFTVMTRDEVNLNDEGVDVDTMRSNWYNPARVKERLLELFPNSTVTTVSEYPNSNRIWRYMDESAKFDDVVFVTYYNMSAYLGVERFTPRIPSLFHALQASGKVSTVLHFGNPYVLEELPHVPRVIIGTHSSMGVEAGLNVLGGEYPAKGKLTYKVNLQ